MLKEEEHVGVSHRVLVEVVGRRRTGRQTTRCVEELFVGLSLSLRVEQVDLVVDLFA